MVYCVNCGVELEKSQRHCPLCGVEANNPLQPFNPALPRPYSAHVAHLQAKLETRFTCIVISILFFLACLVCVLANLVYQNGLTWSVYVVASLSLIWIVALLPLVYTALTPIPAVFLDVMALLAFLYLLNIMDTANDWFSAIALPQVLSCGVIALIVAFLWKNDYITGWKKHGIAVMAIGLALMGLELNLDFYNNVNIQLQWSLFVIIPTLGLGLILFVLERKREVKDEIAKRLRV